MTLSTTLPVKPSQTITSALSLKRSRPSMLPTKEYCCCTRISSCVACRNRSPFFSSSPMLSRPTLGAGRWYTCWARREPSSPNCASTSDLQSALAPTSSSTPSPPFSLGTRVGMQGRNTPGMGLMMNTLPTSMAPVLPVLAKASMRPSFSRWKPMLMLLFGLAWKAFVGLSCMVISSALGTISKAAGSAPSACRPAAMAAASPMSTRRTSGGSSRAASAAPLMGTAGPWSLPMMSSPILMRGSGRAGGGYAYSALVETNRRPL